MDYSVIIPVYNCKDSLVSCVESILQGNLSELEILIIDDGSRDGTAELCDRLAETHTQIRVFHQENRGVSAARNRGIREAAGEYLLFMDGDDTVDGEMLGNLLRDSRWKMADLVTFGMTFHEFFRGSCISREELTWKQEGLLAEEKWGAAFGELFRANVWSPVWNKVFKREILVENNLWFREDLFFYEDLEFVLRYLASCGSIWNDPRAIYHYRRNEGSFRARLERIGDISGFLHPIDMALENLCREKPAVTPAAREDVLMQLYEILAREKIAAGTLAEAQKICRDFKVWFDGRGCKVPIESRFCRRMYARKATVLKLEGLAVQLRYEIARRVKWLWSGG